MDLLHLEFCRAQSQYGMRVDIVESSAHSDVVINRNNNDASPTATREGSQVLAGTARTVHNELRVPTNRCADPLMQEQSRKTLEALGHLSLCHPNKSVTRPKLPSSPPNLISPLLPILLSLLLNLASRPVSFISSLIPLRRFCLSLHIFARSLESWH